MTDHCPHCEVALPSYRDAFCPRCRGSLAEEWGEQSERRVSSGDPAVGENAVRIGRNPLEKFTLPARILIVLSILMAVAALAGYVGWVSEDLTPGRYPLWLFAMPVAVAAGLFCMAGLALLRACGVPVYREHAPASPTNGV